MEGLARAVSSGDFQLATHGAGEKEVIDMLLTGDIDRLADVLLDSDVPEGEAPVPYMEPEERPHA